jgi:hypothetical protein
MALGLIGTALAGAAVGAGEAGKQLGEYAVRSNLQAEADAAQRSRDERLAEFQKEAQTRGFAHADSMQGKQFGHANSMQQAGFKHAEGMQDRGFEHAEGMQEAGFTHAGDMQSAAQAFQKEQNDAQRGLTREQMASHERIASANNANALKIANLGGAIQQGSDGTMGWVDKNGNTKPIMDPNNPDQPWRSNKDLTPAAKQYAEVIKAQMVALEKEEVAGADAKVIADRRAKLNAELLKVLTGGIGEAGKAPAGITPPQFAIDYLKAHPETAEQFKEKYKADPSQFLAGSKPAPKGLIRTPTDEPPVTAMTKAERAAADATEGNKNLDRDKANLQKMNEEVAREFDVDTRKLSPQALYRKYIDKMDALGTSQRARLSQLATDYQLK